MLLTTCPNCSAQFKVQPEQLNVRQGRVMCGRCRNVFNAFQSLTRVAESESAAHALELPATQMADEPAPIPTDSLFLREEPLPLSEEFSQTDYASDARTYALAPVSRSFQISRDTASAPGDFQGDSPSTLTSLLPANAEAPDLPETNPLLAPAPGHRTPRGASHTRIWSSAAVTLLLGLTAQVAYGYRSAIIQSFPQLRPSFVLLCESVGCNLSWGRDDSAIRIEASDLIETPGKAGHIVLTATLVNRGATRQDLPAMELKLTDNANQVILSRILLPHEYLGRTPAKDESLVPNVEMYVNLSIELANKAQASGYGVRAFYN